jgi:hypothetical protein
MTVSGWIPEHVKCSVYSWYPVSYLQGVTCRKNLPHAKHGLHQQEKS